MPGWMSHCGQQGSASSTSGVGWSSRARSQVNRTRLPISCNHTLLRSSGPALEAGLLAPYLYNGLVEHGVPAVCIETGRMKTFAKALPVKTDRKDAHLIALALKAGLYRGVHVS